MSVMLRATAEPLATRAKNVRLAVVDVWIVWLANNRVLIKRQECSPPRVRLGSLSPLLSTRQWSPAYHPSRHVPTARPDGEDAGDFSAYQIFWAPQINFHRVPDQGEHVEPFDLWKSRTLGMAF